MRDEVALLERAEAGVEDPYFLGSEIIGLSKDELPRPIEEIGPYYDWLDKPRPELLSPLQIWLRFWSTSRHTGKTYGFLVWLICRILRDPNIRIIIQSEEKQMAMESIMLMREWMEEPSFINLYGRMESKLWLTSRPWVRLWDAFRITPGGGRNVVSHVSRTSAVAKMRSSS